MIPRHIPVHGPMQRTDTGCLRIQKTSRLIPTVSKEDVKEVVRLDLNGWIALATNAKTSRDRKLCHIKGSCF